MAKKREIIITCNAKQVQDTFEFLNKSLADIKAKMNALNEKGAKDGWTEQMKKDFAELEKMATSINNFDLAPAEKAVRKFEDVLKNLAGSTLKDVKRALNEGKSDLNKMAENDPNRAKLTEDLAKIARQIEIIGGKSQSLAEAKKQLSDLANTPTEKLRQGLAAINKELEHTTDQTKRTELKGFARQYEAQLAVNQYGKAGMTPIDTMNAEQLRAEQQRLRQGYMATEGATGYEGISQGYLARLQAVNQALKELMETERQEAQEAKAIAELKKADAVSTDLYNKQKVSLQQLIDAQKTYEAELKKLQGINLTDADQQKVDDLKAKLEGVKNALLDIAQIDIEKTLDDIGKGTANIEQMEAALKQLEAQEKSVAIKDKAVSEEMARNKRKIQEAIQRVKNQTIDLQSAQNVAANTGKHNVQQLQAAYDTLKQHLMSLNKDQKAEIKETRKQMEKLKDSISDITGEINKQSSTWKTAYNNMVAYVGIFGMINAAKSAVKGLITKNNELSDQLADIRKVSQLTMGEVNELSQNLAKIDTRNSLSQLNELAYLGSKMGLAKYGVTGLTQFTEAAAQLNMALGEDMGEQALPALAKMAEVMGDMKNLGVEKALLSIGSSIYQLAATSTASGSQIMEFSKRLLGIGKTANLTSAEILALGSSADAMALMPEVASTAFNKFIATLQSKYGQIGKAVGIPPETLQSLLEAGKTMDAIVLVLEHMNSMGGLNALMPIMGDLGSEGARLTNVFATMAANVDMLKAHLDTSRQSFEEAIAVTNEFNIQNATSQALMERATNIWTKTFVNTESLDMVKEFSKAWYDVTKSLTSSELFLTEIKLTLGALLTAIVAVTKALPELIAAFALGKLAAVWPTITAAWTSATHAMTASIVTSTHRLLGHDAALAKNAQARIANAQATYVQLKAEEARLMAEIEENQGTVAAVIAEQDLTVVRTELTAVTARLATATGTAAAVTGADVAAKTEQVVAETTAMAAAQGLTIAEGELSIAEGAAAAASNSHAVALGVETGAIQKTTAAAQGLKAAWAIFLVIGVAETIMKITSELGKANEETERAKKLNERLSEALATANQEYDKELKRLTSLYEQMKRNWSAEDERKRLIDQMNREYGDYLENLLSEKSGIDEVTKAYGNATEAMRQYYFYKQKEALKSELIDSEVNNANKAFIQLQQQNGQFSTDQNTGNTELDYRIATENNLMKGVGKYIGDVMERNAQATSETIADELWTLFTGKETPSDFYINFGNVPLVGGLIGQFTGDGMTQEQRDFKYLYEFVKSTMRARNNELAIEANFPGEYTPYGHATQFVDNSGGGSGADKDIKERLRKDLKDAKEQSDAVISKIEEWYRLQETVITDMQADGKLTKEQAEQVIRTLNIAKNTALRDARLAISGRDTEAWEQTKQQIGDLMLDQGQWSAELLQQILAVSMESIRANLARIDAGGGQYGITTTSLKDAVDKNAAGNQREIARLRAQSQQEVEKILLEYHFVETAIKGFSNRLAQMGILTESAQQMAQRLDAANRQASLAMAMGGTGIAPYAVMEAQRIQREQAKGNMLQAFVKTGTQKYTVNPEDEQSLQRWMEAFVKDNEGAYQSWAKPFEQDFELWLSDSKTYKAELQAFYFSLIKSEDEYYEAMKKAYNKQKALFAQRWENSGRAEAYDNLLKQLDLRKRELALTGKDKGTNFVDQAGFSNLNEDPEIAASIARMQQAKEELEMFRETARQKQLAGEELAAFQRNLREKEMAATEAEMAMQEQLMKSIGDRISKLQEWTQPIENFGTEVGQALYDQWHNGESMTAKWQDMLKKMGLAWGQLTIKIVSELMMQRIKQNIIDKAMQADAIKHQATMSTIEQTGGQARQLVQQTTDQALIQGNQTTNTIIETQQQAHNATTLSEDVGQAAAENPVNISRAAGKTLAGLGWWGIPLVAVVTALLNALLQAALGSSSKNSKDATKEVKDAPKTKLVSGMLTYKKGNVDKFAGRRKLYDDGETQVYGRRRYLGEDGKVYTATEEPDPKDGLVTHPIATTVQGQPALVAENGPEIVIGRETTKAIMMNEPELIRYLANYQQHGGRQLYDSGNTSDITVSRNNDITDGANGDAELRSTINEMREVMKGVLFYLQNPVRPKIDMYSHGGEDGLYDSMQKATKFMSRYNG